MAKSFEILRARMSPERRARIAARSAEMLRELPPDGAEEVDAVPEDSEDSRGRARPSVKWSG